MEADDDDEAEEATVEKPEGDEDAVLEWELLLAVGEGEALAVEDAVDVGAGAAEEEPLLLDVGEAAGAAEDPLDEEEDAGDAAAVGEALAVLDEAVVPVGATETLLAEGELLAVEETGAAAEELLAD